MLRKATPADIPAMVSLSYQKRRNYENHHPRFWRYAAGAEEAQTRYFHELLHQDDHILLVAKPDDKIVGFIIGHLAPAPDVYDPGGLTLKIDDFCVESPTDWRSTGTKLLVALKQTAKAKGAVQTLVVCGAHDTPKQELLRNLGLHVASEWYVGGMD